MNITTDSDTALLEEPFVNLGNIQGNIIHGFNKSHQVLLGLKVVSRDGAREWIQCIHNQITPASEVHIFRKLRQVMIRRLGQEPKHLSVSWVNIAFSAQGLRKLIERPDEVDEFEDEAFKLGMPARSSSIGDPSNDENVTGSPRNWKVGGEATNIPDILLILASDRADILEEEVKWWKNNINSNMSVDLFYEEPGADLPDKLQGHEHFGFKDGISQPGIRGRGREPPHEFITQRLIDSNDPLVRSFAAPGQPLIRLGQFVFGYDTQDSFTDGIGRPRSAPKWATDGSFLVYRRLKQEVEQFWDFMRTKAAVISSRHGVDIRAEQLAAMLVGRWPSGAPILRTPFQDNAILAGPVRNNHFQFNNPSRVIPINENLNMPPDVENLAAADFDGHFCPRASHIRKVNPRDLSTEQPGGANDTLTRRILRRGIPFGNVLAKDNTSSISTSEDRGLLFLCYQTSIDDQFEFLSRNWMNQEEAPEGNAGSDLIVGQNGSLGENRVRTCSVTFKVNGNIVKETLEIQGDWVVPTGGGYFFSPSLSALSEQFKKTN